MEQAQVFLNEDFEHTNYIDLFNGIRWSTNIHTSRGKNCHFFLLWSEGNNVCTCLNHSCVCVPLQFNLRKYPRTCFATKVSSEKLHAWVILFSGYKPNFKMALRRYFYSLGTHFLQNSSSTFVSHNKYHFFS